MADENQVIPEVVSEEPVNFVTLMDDDQVVVVDDNETVVIEQEPEVIKTDGEPEKKVEPADKEDDKYQKMFNNMAGMITSTQTQVDALVAANKALVENQNKTSIAAPEKPVFTQEQWDTDAQGCSDANNQYNNDLNAFNANQANNENQNAAQSMRDQHQTDLNQEFAVNPFMANPRIKNAWDDIYVKGGYANMPGGVMKATNELRRQAAANNVDLNSINQDTVPGAAKTEPTQTSEEIAATAAADERARAARVNTQQISNNQSTTKKSETSILTPEQRKFAINNNLPLEAYAKTIKSLGGNR